MNEEGPAAEGLPSDKNNYSRNMYLFSQLFGICHRDEVVWSCVFYKNCLTICKKKNALGDVQLQMLQTMYTKRSD